MWENKHTFNGLSVLPYSGGSYKQAPFEDITKNQYEEMVSHLQSINLRHVHEDTDNTTQKENLACAGGNCEI